MKTIMSQREWESHLETKIYTRLVRKFPELRINKSDAVRIASEMSAREMRDALAPLYEEIPIGHRVLK